VESIRYLALGDSYTIGTGLEDEAQNFASLLAGRLKEETAIDVALVNLGVNGYTTTDLIREELPVARSVRPELVTVLIGANDIVQRSDEATYRGRLQQIYQAIQELGVPAARVLAISIPDFSPLPGAAPFGSARLVSCARASTPSMQSPGRKPHHGVFTTPTLPKSVVRPTADTTGSQATASIQVRRSIEPSPITSGR